MALDAHALPWRGSAYRHLPARPGIDPLDFRFSGQSDENRWNVAGEPTLYLAGDQGVMVTEWGRHFPPDRSSELKNELITRTIYRFDLKVSNIIDLRHHAVWNELGLVNPPHCFLELQTARAIADEVRRTTSAQGILVPPVGLLDQSERWNLVLFLEKLPDPARFITKVTPVGTLQRG